jgi:hypothetical protein
MEFCEDIIYIILQFIISPHITFVTTDIISFEVYESSIIKYSDILELYKIKKIKYIIEKYFKNLIYIKIDDYKRNNRHYYYNFYIIENMILPIYNMNYNIDICHIEKLNIFNKIDYLKIQYKSNLEHCPVVTPEKLIGNINKIEINLDEICLFYNMINELKIKNIILNNFSMNESKYTFKEISLYMNKLNKNCKLFFKSEYVRIFLFGLIKRNGYKVKKTYSNYDEFINLNPYEGDIDFDLYKQWNLNENLKLQKFTTGMSWIYKVEILPVLIDNNNINCGVKRKLEF